MTIRRTTSIVFLLVLIGSVILSSCGEMDPDVDPRLQAAAQPYGRILFAANGDIHMWDGSTHQLTELGNASSPAWEPGGDRYLFVQTGDAYSDLMIGNAESRNIDNLTFNEPEGVPGTPEYLRQVLWTLDPVWDPSGQAFAYASDSGTSKNFVWYQPSLEEAPWRVECSRSGGDNVEHPSFSPDGSEIVFAQRSSSNEHLDRWMELRICDLNSGEAVDLMTGEPGDASFYPTWSPDGEWIAFVRRVEGRTDIWVVPSEGGDPVRLTENGDVTAPEWAPDGSMIAFLDTDGASFDAKYVEFNVGEDGAPTASDPHDLFDVDGIDAPSGLSWSE